MFKKFIICISLITIWHASALTQVSRLDSTIPLQEVSIRATRANLRMMTPTSNVKLKDIQHINLGQDIPTIFQTLPSITSSSDAGNGIGYSYMNIRGLDAQRVQVNINGVPYNDAESHEVYWVNIPDMLQSADDIQIQRGVGYSQMGGSGLGGTISIKTTKRYEGSQAIIRAGIGSFNTHRLSAQGTTGVLPDGWQVTARASGIQSDGYIDRAKSELQSYFLDVSNYQDKWSSHLIGTLGREKTYQSWYGVSEGDYLAGRRQINTAGTDYGQKAGEPYPEQVDHYRQAHLQWINNLYWSQKHQTAMTGYLSQGRGYYEEYKVGQNYSAYLPNLGGSGDLARRLWLDNLLLGINLSHIATWRSVTNTSSLSIQTYRGRHFGELAEIFDRYTGAADRPYYQNNSTKSDLTAFNKTNIAIGSSYLTLDLQIRRISYELKGTLDNQTPLNQHLHFTFLNPKIGWNTTLAGITKVYAFAGMHHREPNRNDIITANAGQLPKPERVYNLELGQQTKHGRVQFNSNFFMMYFDDQLIPTGALNDVGAPIRVNVPKSFRTGLELELDYKISKQWSIYTNQYLAMNTILDYTHFIPTYNADYTINDAQSERRYYTETDIASSPNWISYAELRYRPWARTQLHLMHKAVGQQYLDNRSDDQNAIPLYSFLNLAWTQDLPVSGSVQNLQLQFLINNLFDQSYVSRGYTYHTGNTIDPMGVTQTGQQLDYVYPQAGINFLLGLELRF